MTNDLLDLLACIVERVAAHARPAIRAALQTSAAAALDLQHRVAAILLLATIIAERLRTPTPLVASRNNDTVPDADASTPGNEPQDQDRTHRAPGDQERADSVGLDRETLPALLARLRRDLAALAPLLSPDAEAELQSLCADLTRAAPPTPQSSTPQTPTPQTPTPQTPTPHRPPTPAHRPPPPRTHPPARRPPRLE